VALAALSIAGMVCAPGVAHADAGAREAVVGGAPAPGGALASVAEIIDMRGHQGSQCTGTVVAATLILTAAHCVENIKTGTIYPASGFQVLTGASNLEQASAGAEGQILDVSGVIPYEGFHRRVDDGDAALLALSAPTSAAPIALATSSQSATLGAGATARIAGWGNTFYRQRLLTKQLRWADTVVQSASWCKRNAPPFFVRNEICTIDPPSYATGACNGDSGGPLLAAQGAGAQLVQVGIAIHVYDRCSTRRPSVYTSVDAIAGWVQSWIAAYAHPAAAGS